jgi:ParB-like chromosome segregation protein Spo0J
MSTTDPEGASPEPTETATDEDMSVDRGADQFIADSRTEKVLTDNNVTFELVIVDIADIDLTGLDKQIETGRQMRDEIIHLDVAQRYADDMRHGAEFPAGVLSRHEGKHRVADFHHRLWGAREAGFTQVTAYVVGDMEDFDLVELGNLLNRNHGVPLSENERVRQALWGLELGRFKSVEQAARVLGLKASMLNRRKRVRDTKERARELGIPELAFDTLKDSAVDSLHALRSPEVFREATKKALTKKFGVKEISDMVASINAAPSDIAKLDAIKEFGNELTAKAGDSDTGKVSPLSEPLTRIKGGCGTLLKVNIEGLDFYLDRYARSELVAFLDHVTLAKMRLTTIAEKVSDKIGELDRGERAPQADVG